MKGLILEVDKLSFERCLPADWEGFRMHYRHRETLYHIEVLKGPAGDGGMRVSLDGVEQLEKTIQLADDHMDHRAEIIIPAADRCLPVGDLRSGLEINENQDKFRGDDLWT